MLEKMKAAVLHAPYNVAIEEVKKPKIGLGRVLMRINATAICGTDIEIYTGRYRVKYPLIMGHETAGEIVEVSEGVERVQVGDRVVANPSFSCGKCYLCMMGKRNLCQHGGLLGREANGAYAEYIVIPEHMVFKFPENISYEEATIVQLLGTIFRGQKRVKITPGDSVAILGQGPAGLLHTRLAKLSGANPLVVTSRSEWKLELAQKYGADITINAKKEDPIKSILKHTDDRGADIVIEAAGVPETIKQSIEAVRPGGRILQFGIFTEPINNFNLFHLYFKELVIVGSRATMGEEFEPSIKLIASGAINVKPLITHEFSLKKIKEGLELLDKSPGKALRVIIKL